MEFGSDVHEFAERYVLGEAVETGDNPDKEHVISVTRLTRG